MADTVRFLQVASIVGYALAGCCLVAAVIIFFRQHIYSVILDLSGRYAKRQIEQIRAETRGTTMAKQYAKSAGADIVSRKPWAAEEARKITVETEEAVSATVPLAKTGTDPGDFPTVLLRRTEPGVEPTVMLLGEETVLLRPDTGEYYAGTEDTVPLVRERTEAEWMQELEALPSSWRAQRPHRKREQPLITVAPGDRTRPDFLLEESTVITHSEEKITSA